VTKLVIVESRTLYVSLNKKKIQYVLLLVIFQLIV